MEQNKPALIDTPTLDRIKLLHPNVQNEVTQMIGECNCALSGRAKVRVSQGLRTIAEQNTLYAQGRTKPGKVVTNAKGGYSFHNFGLAFDIVLIIDGKTASWDMVKDFDNDGKSDWKECVDIIKKYGWEHGGDWKSFKDYPHFQKTFGYSTAQLRDRIKTHPLKAINGQTYPKL